MKTKNTDRRCCECRQLFTPDPRVGNRQVTCGAGPCQRQRHRDRCRAWRAANTETTASHYEDVVVPFRERQPDYQCRWRLARHLREIREKMRPLGGPLRGRLRGLLGRAKGLSESPTKAAQAGVLAAELLNQASAAVRGALTAIEQLEASLATLQSMGL
jgi:hypothetical protein